MSTEKKILNKLPAPTFGWLGVNSAQREYKAAELTQTLVSRGAEPLMIDVEDSCIYEIESQTEQFIIMFVSGADDKAVSVRIKGESGSHTKLVQVFEKGAQTVSDVMAELSDGAELELVQFYAGGADTVSEIRAELCGYSAKLTADIGYLLDGEDKLDLNLIADHFGRKSLSEINVRGIMDGESQKIFKGTIDFKNGASGAKGSENEEVLLMNESVRNRSVPLILCAEEDVEGSHGASIGRINEEHIFYMQSRGISEEKIYELMARAKTEQIIKRIGDSVTAQRIYEALGRGDEDDE